MKSMLKIVTPIFLVMALATTVFAAEWGDIRMADRNLNVRKARTPRSEHVVTLKKGQQVKTDFLKNGWLAIFDINETKRSESKAIGYANAKYLKLVKKADRVQAESAPAPRPDQIPEKTEEPAIAPSQPAGGLGAVKAPVVKAPPANQAAGTPGIPVQITADRMTYDETRKMVSFQGNVVAKHDGLTMWANSLSAYFEAAGKKKFQVDSIDRIVAKGNVRAEKGKTSGKCGKVTYKVQERILLMEENPELNDGPNSITGDVIRYFVRENRSEVVSGGGKRVEAIFFTPKGLKVQ